MLMMSLMQPTSYKSQPKHNSSPRCLPHWINTASIWLSAVYHPTESLPLAGLSALRQALMENTQYDINSSGFTLSKRLWILSRCQTCSGGHLFMVVSRVWTGLLFIFTRTQFANAHICISCKVRLLSTAQSLIFQHAAGRAGGYDNLTHNEAAAAAASLLTPAGLNAPSLHIKNTTI